MIKNYIKRENNAILSKEICTMIIDELKKANIEAMKNRDKDAKNIISVVLTRLQLKITELRSVNKDLTDEDTLAIIQKVIKELSDEKADYQKANKLEEVESIKRQEQVLSNYLPKQLSEEEIREEISKLEDKSMPAIMKHFKMNFAGKVDMSLVNKLAREL